MRSELKGAPPAVCPHGAVHSPQTLVFITGNIFTGLRVCVRARRYRAGFYFTSERRSSIYVQALGGPLVFLGNARQEALNLFLGQRAEPRLLRGDDADLDVVRLQVDRQHRLQRRDRQLCVAQKKNSGRRRKRVIAPE